ncbi:FAD-dependent oxidoreductase [Janibacter sp. Y6]|uniref:FAD-dependent oxidoreductase n=1 Tax=Janibacter sp. Y6 TaxID=2913552 RepID=UPI0034A241E4
MSQQQRGTGAAPTRRTVLAGALAATSTLATTGAVAAPFVRPTTRTTAADWEALDRAISGDVLTPGDSAYSSARRLFNPRWDGVSPAAVVRVRSTADVSEAVDFARSRGVRAVVRGGGHSYVGASTRTDAMVLDLRALDSVSLSGTTASVGGGATLYPVKSALAARGRSIPTGSCPTVGAGGLTLGGGLGVDSRAHGLTSDAVVGATVVTRDGSVHRVDATNGSSLFWALRGGGTGLGVVTVWRYRTHATRRTGFFFLTFPTSAAVRVLTGWSRWQAAAPRSVWGSAHVEAMGSKGVRVRVVGVCAAGQEAAQAEALVRAVGVSPTSRSTRSTDYLDGVRLLGGGTTSARESFYAGSDVLRVMTTGTAEAVVGVMARRARSGGTGAAILDPLDGRVQDLERDDTAFPWRAHRATVQWYLGLSSSSATAWSAAADVVDAAHSALGSRSSGGYVNYLERSRPLRDYLAGNADRVAYLRTRYGVR